MNRHTWGSALHGKKTKKRLQCAWVAGNKWKLNYVLNANPKQQLRATALPGARRCSRRAPRLSLSCPNVTAHVMFCSLFLFYFFPPCPVNGSGYHSFYFFPGFFLYFLLCVNSLDKDFRNIVLKNYIEHCAYKLYDELIRKKSSWLSIHRSCVENLY